MNERSTNGDVKPRVYIARALLEDADRAFLKTILDAGGYVLREQAVAFGLRPSKATAYRRLAKAHPLQTPPLIVSPLAPKLPI